MSGRLAGKIALITAAGQGIGRASALAMAHEGARVCATDVKAALLERVRAASPTSARGCSTCSTTRRSPRRSTRCRRSTSCSIAPATCTTARCSTARRRTGNSASDLNVRAMYITIQCALPRMLDQCAKAGSGASIINMASVAGSIKGIPNRFAYGASKAAVVGLHQGGRGRFRHQGHTLQRDRARHRRHAVAARAHQRVSRSGRGAQGVHRAPADGTARQARGDRAGRRVSRVGRIGVRDRECLFGRRRHDDLKRGKLRIAPLTALLLAFDAHVLTCTLRSKAPRRLVSGCSPGFLPGSQAKFTTH